MPILKNGLCILQLIVQGTQKYNIKIYVGKAVLELLIKYKIVTVFKMQTLFFKKCW